MSNHTPRPWIVSRKLDDHYEIESLAVTNDGARTNGQNWIGTVWVPKSSGPKYGMGHLKRGRADYASADANAQLIIAAPDLLEACRVALSYFLLGLPTFVGSDAHRKIASAVRKATGGDDAAAT
jgi:hypothetical protein